MQQLLPLTSSPQSDSVLVDLRGLLSEDDDHGDVDEVDDEEAHDFPHVDLPVEKHNYQIDRRHLRVSHGAEPVRYR